MPQGSPTIDALESLRGFLAPAVRCRFGEGGSGMCPICIHGDVRLRHGVSAETVEMSAGVMGCQGRGTCGVRSEVGDVACTGHSQSPS